MTLAQARVLIVENEPLSLMELSNPRVEKPYHPDAVRAALLEALHVRDSER